MIQFQVLSGKQAGSHWVARRFPVRIGRDGSNDLQLLEAGVWDRHCEVRFDPVQGCIVCSQSDALLTVNREPQQNAKLRNGDTIELGGVQLRFWLADPVMLTLRGREWLLWSLIAALGSGQALLAWLLIP